MFWLADVSSYSYPSGHAANSFVFYIVLMVLLRRYLGVHYPSDVLGGLLIGSFMMLILVGIYDRVWPKKYRISNEPKDWEERKNNKPWREPRRPAKEHELLEF